MKTFRTARGAFVAVALAGTALTAAARADTQPFETEWLHQLQQDAIAAGVPAEVVFGTLSNPVHYDFSNYLAPTPQAAKEKQKEFAPTITLQQYLRPRFNAATIEKGREKMAENASALARIEAAYGVAPEYLMAPWSMESSYGHIFETPSSAEMYNVIPALITLAHDSPDATRQRAFRTELFAALKILAQEEELPGTPPILTYKGSYAGAMGQPQFMPTNLLQFGARFDAVNGPVKSAAANIWSNSADVLASIAYKLKTDRDDGVNYGKGWQRGGKCADEARVPADFPVDELTDMMKQQTDKTVAEWQAEGVVITRDHGPDNPGWQNEQAMLIAPDMHPAHPGENLTGPVQGPVFLVYNNFKSYMAYNKSFKYALANCFIADAIAGRIPTPAPTSP